MAAAAEAARTTAMSEVEIEARPLTSVQLLDAAVWRELGSEEQQPPSAFVDALSRLVARWLLVRSDTPDMDTVRVMCRVRGYVERRGLEEAEIIRWTR
jgi:hypothetical protein